MGSIALFAIKAISLKICFHIALCLFTLGKGVRKDLLSSSKKLEAPQVFYCGAVDGNFQYLAVLHQNSCFNSKTCSKARKAVPNAHYSNLRGWKIKIRLESQHKALTAVVVTHRDASCRRSVEVVKISTSIVFESPRAKLRWQVSSGKSLRRWL